MFIWEAGRHGSSVEREPSQYTCLGFYPGKDTLTTYSYCGLVLCGKPEFVANLAHNEYNLKFTSKCNPPEVTFLDLVIQLGEDHTIKTKLYRKPTSTNSFLHAKSFHPRPLVHNVAVGQYLRACHNCTDDNDFEREAVILMNMFVQ